ncbi:MAG: hypothetical protein WCL32_08145 [Planctomycetota bacterium]
MNAALAMDELASVRKSIKRGTPLGGPTWQQATATRLGLETTLRARGQPPKPNGLPREK